MGKKLAVGRIVTTHGLKGDVKVISLSGETDHFKTMKMVELRRPGESGQSAEGAESAGKEAEIAAVRISGSRIIIKFAGIDSIEEALELKDREIWVSREECSSLDEDEYYVSDLYGCTVSFEGNEIGTIIGSYTGAQAELLEIEKISGGTSLLPFLDVYVGEVDLNKKVIELKNGWIVS